MSEPDGAPATPTGQPEVDAALDGVADLGERPLDEHHDRLSAAHEALHDALQNPSVGRSSDPGDTRDPDGPGEPA